MNCPRCGSQNVNVTIEQVSGKTKTRNMGCLWSIIRFFLIVCTFGLWALIGKRKSTGSTKFKSRTIGLCQSCGNKFYVA